MSDTPIPEIPLRLFWNPPPPAGWFRLWDDFRVAVKTKPDQRHIDNMRDEFGWEWIDHE